MDKGANYYRRYLDGEDDDYYYAQFLYHGAGFQIIAKGLTEQEMVDVISSLLQ